MKNPKISIITVVYNQIDRDLKGHIKNVVDQDYENIEFVVIDGGSTDGTLELLNKNKDSFDYFISEPDQGIYDAMNKGIKASTGDYLFFLNTGDLFVNKSVVSKISEHASTNPDIINGNIIQTDGEHELHDDRKLTHRLLRRGRKVSHQSFFAKKGLYVEHGGFNPKYKLSADYDFMSKALSKYAEVENVDIDIVYFDTRGASSNLKEVYNENLEIINEYWGKYWAAGYMVFSLLSRIGVPILRALGGEKLYNKVKNRRL